jgi:hypothetical protein
LDTAKLQELMLIAWEWAPVRTGRRFPVWQRGASLV